MADNALTIEPATAFDNIADRQVEFRGHVDGEAHLFAVQYSVLEALGGPFAEGDAAALFAGAQDAIADAGLIALARAGAEDVVVISENDLDRTASTAPGPHAGPGPDGFPPSAR